MLLQQKTWFLIVAGILIILQAVDGLLTQAVLATGIGYELNPILVGAVDLPFFWLWKVFITAGLLGFLYYRIKGQDKYYRLCAKWLAGLGVFYIGVVFWNGYCLYLARALCVI